LCFVRVELQKANKQNSKKEKMSQPNRKIQTPTPPHPQQRREPLPWQQPKPIEEDPDAQKRIEAILKSPSYRQAEEDADFLNRGDTRGPRLQIDYLKAEILLEQHDIQHTVVVFGSTRIRESAAAQRNVDALRAAQAADPSNTEIAQRLGIAERILAKSHYYDVAREFGRLVGKSSQGSPKYDLVVMTGGGPGIMEAANRGAYDVAARSIGLNIRLPHEQFPNPYITPDLCFCFHYFALRKLHFLLRAKALVAFPGGYGTFDELFETLTLVQTRTIKPVPVVLVGERYWRQVFNVDFMVNEGVIDPEDRDLFWFAETAEEIWEGIMQWYEASGEPLLPRA
jgi:uncharacterized protein (TIGR00730 family)